MKTLTNLLSIFIVIAALTSPIAVADNRTEYVIDTQRNRLILIESSFIDVDENYVTAIIITGSPDGTEKFKNFFLLDRRICLEGYGFFIANAKKIAYPTGNIFTNRTVQTICQLRPKF